MRVFELAGPEFADPAWLRGLMACRATVPVRADGTVEVNGQALRFRGEPPAAGQAVQVWVGRYHYCAALVSELEADERARKAERDAAAARARERADARRDEARAVNEALGVPVDWTSAHKVVLSGLTARSGGDGCNRRTVVHVMLNAAIDEEGFKRVKGSLLCTSTAGSNGRLWTSEYLDADGHGQPFRARVTCRACLRLASRWAKPSAPAAMPAG